MGVVLVRPKIAGNIGAIARVMANFGFKELVLLDPKVDHLSGEAKERAMHAKPILKKAVVVDNWDEIRAKFNPIIGTTGKRASKYNLRRLTISPKEAAERIKGQEGVGLVFGGERIGLTNEEIDKCDFLVSIKTSEDYPVMNLSHAVAVVLHEVYSCENEEPIYNPASQEVKKAVLDWVDKILKNIEVDRAGPMRSVIKRLISRSMIKEREAFTLAGFFREIYNKIKRVKINF